MTLKLGDINQPEPNLPCALTMLCAISDKTPDEMGLLLQQVCADDDRQISARRMDYSPKDWLEAIKRLGGNVVTEDCRPMPTIVDWMKNNTSPHIVVVATSDGQGEDHVFATQQGQVVDTYSNGKLMPYPGFIQRLARQVVYQTHTITNSASASKT